MLGSVRRDRRLADMLRTPWGISVVTCNTVQADTSFGHHFDLPRVSVSVWDDVGQITLTSLTGTDGFFKVLNRLLLATEAVALLVMQPAKLLKDLCMIRIPIEHTAISQFSIVILQHLSVGSLLQS
jgi:hypothetical protein